MKNLLTILLAVLFINAVSAQNFTLKSSDLGGQATNKQVFNGFGCKGENISPQLSWSNAPTGTKSFAITIYDEDAPTGSGWWHWLVFDIPSNTTELKQGAGNVNLKLAPPSAIQSITDFRTTGYGGPCPPEGHGPHKYTITVFALKVDKLGLDANANPALVGFMLKQNSIEQASIVFYFKR
jgi:Raf kinase inhibitor-like YbhB/YbcL family protein